MKIQRKKERIAFRDMCFTYGDCEYAKLYEPVTDSDGDEANAILLENMVVIEFDGNDEVVPSDFILVDRNNLKALSPLDYFI